MLEGNDLTVLHNGEAAYPVMLKAISEAKERVFLSSFIFGYDEVGKSFAAALRAAIAQDDLVQAQQRMADLLAQTEDFDALVTQLSHPAES